MKVKKEHIVLATVLLALVLYLALRGSDRTHYRLPKLPHVPGRQLSKIELSKLDASIILSKRDNSWYIAPVGYPADSRKVNDIVTVIETLTLTALVSESKNYSRYDLGNDKKITVRAWVGDTLRREFDVGKAAPSYRHTFVKLAGDDRVYHAAQSFRGKFDQTVQNLWDRTVLSFERNEIHGIHIIKDEQSMLLDRKETPMEVKSDQVATDRGLPPKSEPVWQSVDGKEVDESKLNRLFAALSNLRCEKYIEGRKKDDFTDPVYTLTLKGRQEYTLSLFVKTNKEAKNYPATSSQSDFPFLLAESQAKKIMVDPQEMMKKPEKS